LIDFCREKDEHPVSFLLFFAWAGPGGAATAIKAFVFA